MGKDNKHKRIELKPQDVCKATRRDAALIASSVRHSKTSLKNTIKSLMEDGETDIDELTKRIYCSPATVIVTAVNGLKTEVPNKYYIRQLNDIKKVVAEIEKENAIISKTVKNKRK